MGPISFKYWLNSFKSMNILYVPNAPQKYCGRVLNWRLNRHISIFVVWSLLNIAIGVVGLIFAVGSWFYFSMMSASWGIVNLLIAVGLYFHICEGRFLSDGGSKYLEIHNHVERMFVVNIGLDFLYLGVGIFLLKMDGFQDVQLDGVFKGFGWAIICQGSYLWLQDLYFFVCCQLDHENCLKLLNRH